MSSSGLWTLLCESDGHVVTMRDKLAKINMLKMAKQKHGKNLGLAFAIEASHLTLNC